MQPVPSAFPSCLRLGAMNKWITTFFPPLLPNFSPHWAARVRVRRNEHCSGTTFSEHSLRVGRRDLEEETFAIGFRAFLEHDPGRGGGDA